LPSIVLVRIGVVADPSDHKTWEVIHPASRFHLKADTILADVSNNPIASRGVFDKRVARCDGPVVDFGISSVSRIAWNFVSRVTVPRVQPGDMVV
jgi:hypothetical protein